MKKLLVLVLVLCVTGAASATTIFLIAPAAGEPGSASNPLSTGETLRVYIGVSDNYLDTYAATITATGAGFDITGGISGGAEVADYGVQLTKAPETWGGAIMSDGGWQSSLSLGSVVDSTTQIRQHLGQFSSTIYGPHLRSHGSNHGRRPKDFLLPRTVLYLVQRPIPGCYLM